MCSVAAKVGCTAETLRQWVRQAERDRGERGEEEPDDEAIEVHRRAGNRHPGDEWAPPPRVDNAMVKALARAVPWRRMLATGVHATLDDLARAMVWHRPTSAGCFD